MGVLLCPLCNHAVMFTIRHGPAPDTANDRRAVLNSLAIHLSFECRAQRSLHISIFDLPPAEQLAALMRAKAEAQPLAPWWARP